FGGLERSRCLRFRLLDLAGKTALPKRSALTRGARLDPKDIKEIKAIIDLMKKHDLSVFEMEKDGFRLKLQKGPSVAEATTASPAVAAAPKAAPAVSESAPAAPKPIESVP